MNAYFAVAFFLIAGFIFCDLIWFHKPDSIKDATIRNLIGYLSMIIGHIVLNC